MLHGQLHHGPYHLILLAVGKKITYVKVNTYNSYNSEPITIILAKELLHKYFTEGILLSDYKQGDKQLPYQIIEEYKGEQLSGINYHQLLNYAQQQMVMHSG